VSIDEAINNDIKRVKVITKKDIKFVFDSIYYKNEKLFGILIIDEKKINRMEIHINPDNIKEIHLFNKSKSRGMTALIIVGIPIGIIGIALAIWAAQGYPLNIDLNWN
jgi:hypothetical protein